MQHDIGESQQLQQEWAALLEASRAILTYREFKEAARAIFDSCKKLIKATAGYVALVNNDGTENTLLFLDSGGQTCTVDPSQSMPIRGMREKVYRTGQVEYDNDFSNSPWVEFLPMGHARLENVLFAPLILEGKSAGLLGLANKAGGFTANDARLAASFAEFAAIALFNSRLLHSLHHTRAELEVLVQERTAAFENASESLRNCKTTYRTLVENIPLSTFVKDRNSVYISCNENFARDLGITREEFEGKNDYVFFPEELANKYRADDQRIMESGETEEIEEHYLKQGQKYWVHTIKTPLRNEQDAVIGILGIFSDITERKKTQDALEEREERYRCLIEALNQSNIGLLLMDANYRVRFMNQSMVTAFGDQTGRICYEGIGQRDSPCSHCKLVEVIRQQRKVSYQPTTSNGKIYDIVAVPFLDTDGTPCKLEIVQDITERKQAQLALLESERRLRSFYDSGLLGVIYWNMDGQIIDANDKFLELVGYTRDDLVAGHVDWLNMTPPEFSHLDDRAIVELKATGVNRLPYEKEYIRKDGTRVPILLAGAMLNDERSTGVAFVLDITERKQAEQTRAELEEQLRGAQKMDAIGNLAGGIAHDFNNMLSVILSYAKFAMDALHEGDPMHDDLLQIQKAGERAAALTRQLLAFSRKQVLEPKLLDLNQIIVDLEKMLRRILGEDIDLMQVLDPDLGLTLADSGQIEQVLMNLVVNARDAMPKGGKLTIETANAEINENYTALHLGMTPGSYVFLVVTDTGSGMDERTRSRIFEPFFTTKEKSKGTGLGLSTVYGIIKQSGGNIWVYSEPGHGTTFKIYLPRATSALAPIAKTPTVVTPCVGTEMILIVEDEEAILNLSKRILSTAGYTVLTAANGGEALLICETHQGEIHLVVTDVVMPKMSGRVLAERLAVVRPGIKVLYMSGYTDNAIVHHGVLDPGTPFISKPFNATDLTRKVREVLNVP